MAENLNEHGFTIYPKYLYDEAGEPLKDENGTHKIAVSKEDEIAFLKSLEPAKEPVKKIPPKPSSTSSTPPWG